MELKKHHKWFLGGFGTLVLIYMVLSFILINGLIIKQIQSNNELINIQAENQNNFNEIADRLIENQKDLTRLGVEFETIDGKFEFLKASVGEGFSEIIPEVIKSVVTIRTDISQGTGFIISEEGYLVTNAHTLINSAGIKTIDYEQNEKDAKIIGYDEELDIALLQIEGKFEYLEFENSDNVSLGENVIAIGNPLGLQFSVSEGIVSGLKRIGPNKINAYIQTDVALNPGNSGGPLINKKGKVIGINNFKMGSGEGLGFSLESDHVKIAINKISNEKLNKTLLD